MPTTRSRPARTYRRALALVLCLTVLTGLLAAATSVVTNLATVLVPTAWVHAHRSVVLAVLGALVLAGVGVSVWLVLAARRAQAAEVAEDAQHAPSPVDRTNRQGSQAVTIGTLRVDGPVSIGPTATEASSGKPRVPPSASHPNSDNTDNLPGQLATNDAPQILTAGAVERAAEEIKRDFFISFVGADRRWAAWVARELEAAGYSVIFQDWDFLPDVNLPLAADRAMRQTKHTIVVLSPTYLARGTFTQPGCATELFADPTAAQRLSLVRVAACQPTGWLASIVSLDLVGLDAVTARQRLREQFSALQQGRRKLPTATPRVGPARPGATATAIDAATPAQSATPSVRVDQPQFPGDLPTAWNVPYRRNPDFTGRQAPLVALGRVLNVAR